MVSRERLVDDAPWMARAECRGLETDNPPPALCETCAVRGPCLAYALDHRITVGRWGGLTADQRAFLLDEHSDDTYGAVLAGADIALVPDPGVRARAMARHPSANRDTRNQLALPLEHTDDA